MSGNVISAFARVLSRHPLWSLLLVLLLTIASALLIREHLRLETDVAALLPVNSRVAQTARQALSDFGGFDFMFCVIEARDEESAAGLPDVASKVARALDDRTWFRRVTWRLEADQLDLTGEDGKGRLLALLTERDWERIEERLSRAGVERALVRLKSLLNAPLPPAVRDELRRDPLDLSATLRDRIDITRGPLKLNLNDGYFRSEDGQMQLILLWPAKPSTELLFANGLRSFTRETQRALDRLHPEWEGRYRVSFTGAHVEAVAEADQLRRDARVTTFFSAALVLALFLVAFRRPEALLFAIVPTLFAVVWTLGFCAQVIGHITQVTAIFAAILIGIGIDYSIYLYNRYIEEVRGGATPEVAVNQAVEHNAPSSFASAIATSIAFYSMAITNFRGFSELGIVVGTGILLSLLSVYLLMPVLLRLFARGEHGLFTKRPLSSFGLRRVHFMITSYPRATMLGLLAMLCFLALNSRTLTFDADFQNLRQPSKEYTDLKARIDRHFETPSNQVIAIIEADSLDAALRDNDLLYRNILSARNTYRILAIDSLRTFYPSTETQRSSLRRMALIDMDALQMRISDQARKAGINPAFFSEFFQSLRDFHRIADERLNLGGPIVRFDDEASETFNSLVQRYVYAPDPGTFRVMTQIYPPRGEWVDSVPEPFIEALNRDLGGRVEVTGVPIIANELRRIVVRDLALVVLLVLVSITIYCMLHFRSVRRGLLAVVPILTGILATLGTAALMDIRLNYVNIIAIPVLIGIGVDSTIHMLHRYYETPKPDLRMTVERTGRAVVLSGLTTIAAFAALLLADYRPIREIGLIAVTGLSVVLVTSLVLLPGILRLQSLEALFTGGDGDDLG